MRQESPDKLRGASVDAAWTQAVVPELPSGLREDRSTVATDIADLIRQASRVAQNLNAKASSPATHSVPAGATKVFRMQPLHHEMWHHRSDAGVCRVRLMVKALFGHYVTHEQNVFLSIPDSLISLLFLPCI